MGPGAGLNGPPNGRARSASASAISRPRAGHGGLPDARSSEAAPMTPFQAAGTWVAQVPSVTLLSGAFGAAGLRASVTLFTT